QEPLRGLRPLDRRVPLHNIRCENSARRQVQVQNAAAFDPVHCIIPGALCYAFVAWPAPFSGTARALRQSFNQGFRAGDLIMSVLRLIQFTDPHLYGNELEMLRGIATLPALKAALADAQSSTRWPPNALLVTGDIVQDDPAGYAHLRQLLGSLGLPVLCIPGNHDEPHAMRGELAGEPFVLGSFADFGAWRIVLLDSCLPGSASGRLNADTLRQLDQALRSAQGRHCLVTLHH